MAIAGGLKEKIGSGTAPEIPNLITGGALSKFADDAAALTSPDALQQGKSLLTSIFGSQDLTNVVRMVAEKWGVSRGSITSLLPVAATLLGGFLSKSTAGGRAT